VEGNYDVLIDFTGLPLTAAFCAHKAAAPSIGFQRLLDTASGKIDLGLCYDKSSTYSENVPIRDLMSQLVSPWDSIAATMKSPTLNLNNKAIDKADKLMNERGLKAGNYMVLHPGGKWPPKRWPICHWRELLEDLTR